jgi:hypothetical protein
VKNDDAGLLSPPAEGSDLFKPGKQAGGGY